MAFSIETEIERQKIRHLGRYQEVRIVVLFLLVMPFSHLQAQIMGQLQALHDTGHAKSNYDLQFLDDRLRNVRVVGIGEASHGTSEFQRFNLKLLTYLVHEHDFNTVFLEDEVAACLQIDKYIKESSSRNRNIISKLTLWPWQTEEMDELVEWMRMYNQSHPERMLSFVGVDIQKPQVIAQSINDLLLSDQGEHGILSDARTRRD